MTGNLISNHGLFSSYESQQGAANGQDSWGVYQGRTGLWAVGSWLTRRLPQPKASTALDLGITNSLISGRFVALRNLGLLISDLSALLLRTLAVGRRRQSESIGVALDMEQGS